MINKPIEVPSSGSGAIECSDCDDRFVNATGDTMTGQLKGTSIILDNNTLYTGVGIKTTSGDDKVILNSTDDSVDINGGKAVAGGLAFGSKVDIAGHNIPIIEGSKVEGSYLAVRGDMTIGSVWGEGSGLGNLQIVCNNNQGHISAFNDQDNSMKLRLNGTAVGIDMDGVPGVVLSVNGKISGESIKTGTTAQHIDIKFWKGTQEQYNGLTPDDNTQYIIVG